MLSFNAKTNRTDPNEWLPLEAHLRDTAGVMQKLLATVVPKHIIASLDVDFVLFKKAAIFTAAVHDIGKATSVFQSQIHKIKKSGADKLRDHGLSIFKDPESYFENREGIRHDKMGQWILEAVPSEAMQKSGIPAVVGAHHTLPTSRYDDEGEQQIENHHELFFGNGEEGQWRKQWKEIIEFALDISGLKTVDDLPELCGTTQIVLLWLIHMADWIASATDYFPLLSTDTETDDLHYPERIETGWNKLNLPGVWTSDTYRMNDTSFKERFGFLPNDVQKAFVKIFNRTTKPGLYILEAPMGVGKTEAGLAAAEIASGKELCGGLFFGTPSQATSNGIFPRVYEWGSSIAEDVAYAIRLAHGSAFLNNDYSKIGKFTSDSPPESGLAVHPWFSGGKKALLANFTIGTVDQALMSVLGRTWFDLRLCGLAGKMVIIDEVHAYDTYMSIYLERMLTLLGKFNTPVILLSATLPAKKREDLVNAYRTNRKSEAEGWKTTAAYPLITWTDGEHVYQEKISTNIKKKKVHLNIRNRDEMFAVISQKLDAGACCGIVVNTVRKAQELYDIITHDKRFKTCREVILYHAGFTMPDRIKKENHIMEILGKRSTEKERRGIVIIGTQVLEQSLDYDVDIMVSDLCPIDLLLQRIGRLHRHERTRPNETAEPECIILNEGNDETFSYDKGTRSVYKDYHLLKTIATLPETVTLPDEISILVQKVYEPEEDVSGKPEEYIKAFEEYKDEEKRMKNEAKKWLLNIPRKTIKGIIPLDTNESDNQAEARVRYGTKSLEVILLKEPEPGILSPVSAATKGLQLKQDETPLPWQAKKLCAERIRMPYLFNVNKNLEAAVTDRLREDKISKLYTWNSEGQLWLRDEYALVLDKDSNMEIGGFIIHYDSEMGLTCSKKEGASS